VLKTNVNPTVIHLQLYAIANRHLWIPAKYYSGIYASHEHTVEKYKYTICFPMISES
jgi:hypothetical protein